VGSGIVRPEGKSTPVSRNGVINSSLRCERDAQIVVAVGIVRLEKQGMFVSRNGVAYPSRHMMPQGIVEHALDTPGTNFDARGEG
jgi:hypothetical protein